MHSCATTQITGTEAGFVTCLSMIDRPQLKSAASALQRHPVFRVQIHSNLHPKCTAFSARVSTYPLLLLAQCHLPLFPQQAHYYHHCQHELYTTAPTLLEPIATHQQKGSHQPRPRPMTSYVPHSVECVSNLGEINKAKAHFVIVAASAILRACPDRPKRLTPRS